MADKKQWSNPPEMQIESDQTYTALLKTTRGEIELELYPQYAPITVNNFVFLANEKYYDGTVFHRVIANFVIQGGDPTGTGMGGPGYTIKDEFGPNNRNGRGTISMANSGPNTGGSQFFINLVDNNYLDGKHPVFGEVVEGMEFVDAIGKVKTGPRDKPLEDVVITKATVIS